MRWNIFRVGPKCIGIKEISRIPLMVIFINETAVYIRKVFALSCLIFWNAAIPAFLSRNLFFNYDSLSWHPFMKNLCEWWDIWYSHAGSEISFFKNGACQGVAFTDLYGGRYYPAASLYTHPNQPSCEVRFNFGPDFEFFPEDFGGRPVPRPMLEAPYHGVDSRAENGEFHRKRFI